VTLVQLREKHTSGREFFELAVALKKLLLPKDVPLIINDRIDIALAAKADGIHIGQSDIPYDKAREILGAEAIIGLSIDTDEQLREADASDVDYLGLGPVFATKTKPDHSAPLGLDGFATRRALTRHPTVAIGSVTAKHASALRNAGADGVAVVSAICAAENPMEAARRIRTAFEEG
jgi:thiamine-phosphate pyrophosphorylase